MVSNTLVMSCIKTHSSAFARWFFIVCVMVGAMPAALWAQQSESTDFESPIIEHSTLEAGAIGGVEVFGATVVDNEGIAKVSLFYRFSGETQFAERNMREIASSSFYSVKVDTADAPEDTKAIEYYLQAQDTSGNIVLKGFAFQPLLRTFDASRKLDAIASSPPAAEPEPAPPKSAASKKLTWVYIAAGVLIAGGLAVAASNDDGGSSNNNDACVGGCDLTLTFERP